jgi:hypothetical protein
MDKEVFVLKWRRVPREENDNETAWGPVYEARDEFGKAGYAVKTGTHLDSYPWDWNIEPILKNATYANGRAVRTGGSADTLRSAKDQAEQAARLTRKEVS